MQKGYKYILSSISHQILAVYPAINDMVDLCPNICCNNSKAICFLDGNLFVFENFFISPQNACFPSALCGKVTVFSLCLQSTPYKTLFKKKLCTKCINVIMENNLLHKSGAKIMLYNVAIKVSLLSSHLLISTCPFCFSVTWCTSATSICLSVFYNKPGIKSEICGVIWHVAPESTIQLVTKIPTRTLIIIRHTCHICIYILVIIIFLLLHYFCDARLPLSLKYTCFCRFSF